MNTKTQRKHQEQYKEQKKIAAERFANPDEHTIAALENYCLYLLMYVNDMACTKCRFLGTELKKLTFRTKRPEVLHNALMKRVKAYMDMIDSSELDQNALANLFSEMDLFMDNAVGDFEREMTNALKDHNVPNYEVLAKCETTRAVCDYAVCMGHRIVESLNEAHGRGFLLKPFILQEMLNVMNDICSYVYASAHIGGAINLNEIPALTKAFNKLNKTFISPDNFAKALANAEKENKEDGNKSLMTNSKDYE